ncbi:MAG: heme A synthase [Candidatus Methylacidiphilales bacterium]|nr:COX15/CtaA family protein [Candidatus Methylacidiphilales bacterium]
MSSSPSHRLTGLHRYALFLALAAFILITSGGIVTSHNAGMAVPDWPNSFGYNMFLLPVSKWFSELGIIQEHTHRLIASYVGMFTIAFLVYIYWKDGRGWMRMLGVLALAAVIIQGVLGGLRVLNVNTDFGVVHGCLAQAFFTLICLMALFTSPWWVNTSVEQARRGAPVPAYVPRFLVVLTAAIFLQLTLGATMRHAHIGKAHLGLAVPDFPLAYGQLWPDTSPAALEKINAPRDNEPEAIFPITKSLIHIHMTHRIMAVLLVLGTGTYCVIMLSQPCLPGVLRRSALIWVTLVFLQFCLGAATIWTGKAADVATMHVAVGTLLMMSGAVQAAMAYRLMYLRNAVLPSGNPKDGTAKTAGSAIAERALVA